jgi:hypothetical protein
MDLILSYHDARTVLMLAGFDRLHYETAVSKPQCRAAAMLREIWAPLSTQPLEGTLKRYPAVQENDHTNVEHYRYLSLRKIGFILVSLAV